MSRRLQITPWVSVAVVVIAAFLFVSWRTIESQLANARLGSCKALLSQLESALVMYRMDFDFYPKESPGLEALTRPRWRMAKPFFEYRVNGELRSQILDPWGHPFVYKNPGHGIGNLKPKSGAFFPQPIDLYSVGPNGIDDKGKGDDVTSN